MILAIDIDDTLCYTTHRRMQVFQDRFGNPEWLSVDSMVETYEIVQRVPYRQTPEAQSLIEELITDDSNRSILQPIPWWREALKELQKTYTIVYLTSRQEQHRSKTLDRLKTHNFPEHKLIMRPTTTNDALHADEQFSWKAQYLCQHYPEIIGIIDNSVSLAEQLHSMKYAWKHILFWHDIQKKYATKHIMKDWKKSNKKIIEFLI